MPLWCIMKVKYSIILLNCDILRFYTSDLEKKHIFLFIVLVKFILSHIIYNYLQQTTKYQLIIFLRTTVYCCLIQILH